MTVRTGSGDDTAVDPRQSAERFWHLDRGLRVAFFLAFAILVAVLALRRTGYDLYLDAAYGRMVARGGPGAVSGGSDLRQHMPSSGWLWWVVSFGLVRLGGVRAAAFFAALATAGGFAAVLAALARRVNVVAAGLVLLLGAYLVRLHLFPGSQAAGILLFGALAALLLNSSNASGSKAWWAVPLMLVYVNMDISWPAGFALCAAFLVAFAFSKTPAKWTKCAALAVALAATLVNPDFTGAWGVLRLPVPETSVGAWLSPISGAVRAGKGAAFAFAAAGVLLGLLSLSPASLALAATSVLMIIMGLGAANFPFFAISAAAAVAFALGALAEKIEAKNVAGGGAFMARWVNPLLVPEKAEQQAAAGDAGAVDWVRLRMTYGLASVVGAVALVAVLALVARAAGRAGWGVASSASPERAVRFLKEQHISGLGLVEAKWSGYLLWQGDGGMTVVADGRPLAVSGEAVWATAWAFAGIHLRGEPEAPLARLKDWGVSFALVGQPWGKAQDFSKVGWRPVWWDDFSAVLVPPAPENAELVAKYDRSLTYPPLFAVDVSDAARMEKVMLQLEDKLAREGESGWARYELAVCNFAQKKYSEAEFQLIFALAAKEDLAPAWHLRGDLYRLDGKDDAAIEFYAAAVMYQPDLAMAYLRLGDLLLKRGDWARGIRSLRQAQEADDVRPQLDGITPGLRKQLDEKVRLETSPQRFLPARPPAQAEGPPAAPSTAAPGQAQPPVEPARPPAQTDGS